MASSWGFRSGSRLIRWSLSLAPTVAITHLNNPLKAKIISIKSGKKPWTTDAGNRMVLKPQQSLKSMFRIQWMVKRYYYDSIRRWKNSSVFDKICPFLIHSLKKGQIQPHIFFSLLCSTSLEVWGPWYVTGSSVLTPDYMHLSLLPWIVSVSLQVCALHQWPLSRSESFLLSSLKKTPKVYPWGMH